MTALTVADIAALCEAALAGDGARTITGPASLEEASGEEVSFLANPRYLPALETTRAAAVLVPRGTTTRRSDLTLLHCENPSRAFTRVVEVFRPQTARPAPGVHASAVVDPTASVAADASVGPCAVVGAGARVAARAVLLPGSVVGPGASVGADSVLHPGVVLYHGVEVGERCIVHANTVVGSDGFGFEPTQAGWTKIPQCGTVVVEDDVEIGANCAIDRGRFGATRIGRGAKLDNLVHVAHNVVVGPGALLIAQVGVAGSARIGARAILAGQVGVIGHVTIGDGARVAAQSGVSKDLEPGADYFGSPARPQAEAYRILREYGRLPELAQRIRRLERALDSVQSVERAGGEA